MLDLSPHWLVKSGLGDLLFVAYEVSSTCILPTTSQVFWNEF